MAYTDGMLTAMNPTRSLTAVLEDLEAALTEPAQPSNVRIGMARAVLTPLSRLRNPVAMVLDRIAADLLDRDVSHRTRALAALIMVEDALGRTPEERCDPDTLPA